ncbi:hypothetical protein Pla175_01570 [Pirellulimonas nuda]|uniref:Uncharacterized protein n=2 Tax=Pirellulimonas nuda TaxID=2528009 RepID=A0A518D5Q6_9BACT|nr:hypothetical protein Pla175_01570 [Pirellulimonas nuda]
MLAAVALAATGCHGSRWARTDPDYARKYPDHSDRPVQMAKQAVDARYVAGKEGVYTNVLGPIDTGAVGVSFGKFEYGPMPWYEGHYGLAGLIDTTSESISIGIEGGLRLQSPTRLAPFVGVGGYAGFTPTTLFSSNDDDRYSSPFMDEPDEPTENADLVFAALPEAGVHFWLTPHVRLTGSATYIASVSTGGGSGDAFGWNCGLSFLTSRKVPRHPYCGDSVAIAPAPALTQEEDDLWPSEPLPWTVGETPLADPSGAAAPEVLEAYRNLRIDAGGAVVR